MSKQMTDGQEWVKKYMLTAEANFTGQNMGKAYDIGAAKARKDTIAKVRPVLKDVIHMMDDIIEMGGVDGHVLESIHKTATTVLDKLDAEGG